MRLRVSRRATHPEDTDRVEGTVWRPVGLDHAEHAMQLPVDEEHDEQVMRVPEPLKVCPSAFLNGKEHHGPESRRHDPPSRTGARDELREDERRDHLAGRVVVGVGHGEFGVVDHVGSDVDKGEEDDRPGDHLVEGDVLVKGDEVIERGASEEGDEVPADGEEDKDDIDVEDEGGRTGND